MSTTGNDRICWKCEEAIHSRATSCPYCGAKEASSDLSNEKTFESHAPPYRLATPAPQDQMSAIPQPPYAQNPQQHSPKREQEASSKHKGTVHSEGIRDVLIPLTCLLTGSVCFLFGLVLLFFSQHGVFTLKWNGDRWPFYLIPAIPLLILGWRALRHLEEDSLGEENS